MKGLRSFTERKALHSPEHSWGAHITTLGLGLFLLLLLALYSANLVNILVAETYSGQDIDDIISSGAKVCALEASVSILELAQPDLNLVVDEVTGLKGLLSWSSMWAHLDNGECDVAIATPDQLQMHHANSNFCGWCQIGPPIIYAHAGIPVANNPELLSIHHSFQSILSTGAWRQILAEARPAPTCGFEYNESNMSFNMWDVLGPVMVLVLLILVGLSVSIVDLVRDVRKEQKQSEGLWAALKRKFHAGMKAQAAKQPGPEPIIIHTGDDLGFSAFNSMTSSHSTVSSWKSVSEEDESRHGTPSQRSAERTSIDEPLSTVSIDAYSQSLSKNSTG
eukprot:scaffold59392_cov50-Prasinocladus_malaysianus.AAC.1